MCEEPCECGHPCKDHIEGPCQKLLCFCKKFKDKPFKEVFDSWSICPEPRFLMSRETWYGFKRKDHED